MNRESTRCRCRFCTRRRSLSQHPDHFIKVPKCGCGGERSEVRKAELRGRPVRPTWRVDKYRNSGREQAGKNCRCDEYSFPHTKGRGWCIHNESKTREDREAYS